MAICKLIFASFLALTIIQTCNGASLSHGLTLLGSKISVNGHNESVYFTSQQPTSWKDAQFLCISVLGNNASLISIETRNELVHISELLAAGNNKMASYWTAGKFEDEGREIFSWGMGEPLENWIWSPNEPSKQGRGVKTAMRKNGDGNWTANSLQETERHGFICEITPGSSSQPEPCFKTNDLIIAMDSSGSIPYASYNQAKNEFVMEVVTAWRGWNKTRLSFIIYSDDAKRIFKLNNDLNEFDMEEEIQNAPHLASGTASNLALAAAYEDFQLYHRNVTASVVFLTDGQSNDRDLTREQAQNLHRFGVRVFSIGIGENIVEEELKDIASSEKHVFQTETFAKLKDLLHAITQRLCGDSD